MSQGVGRVTLTNADLRENFRVAAIMIADANGVDIKSIDLNQLVQGYVLSMIDAKVNFSQLQFPITNTDLGVTNTTNIPIMRVVNQVDSFVAGKLGYYLMPYMFANGNQLNPDYSTQYSWMAPLTYPSTYAANGTGTDFSPGIIMFWHGYISIEINGIKLYKNWECMQHLYIPQHQATPQLPATLALPGPDNPFALTAGLLPTWQPNFRDPFDGGNDSFYPMEPLPVFSGSKQSIVTLNLPANIPATIAPFSDPTYGTVFVLKICLHLRGVLAQNSTSLK